MNKYIRNKPSRKSINVEIILYLEDKAFYLDAIINKIMQLSLYQHYISIRENLLLKFRN